jgi:hypothetical protein
LLAFPGELITLLMVWNCLWRRLKEPFRLRALFAVLTVLAICWLMSTLLALFGLLGASCFVSGLPLESGKMLLVSGEDVLVVVILCIVLLAV